METKCRIENFKSKRKMWNSTIVDVPGCFAYENISDWNSTKLVQKITFQVIDKKSTKSRLNHSILCVEESWQSQVFLQYWLIQSIEIGLQSFHYCPLERLQQKCLGAIDTKKFQNPTTTLPQKELSKERS